MSAEHRFRRTIFVTSAADAEEQAHVACKEYFGARPYRMVLLTSTHARLDGRVIHYEVDVIADEVTPVPPTPPDDPDVIKRS